MADLLPTRAADGRTMIGHVVVCRSAHDDAIALWQVSTDGFNTGAYVVPSDVALTDPETAARLLSTCVGRGVISWTPAEPIALLRRLEQVAGTACRPWERDAIALPDALAEIAEMRTKLVERVTEQQAINKQVAGIEWPIDLPEALPETEAEMCRAAGLQPGDWAHPSAVEALQLCRLVSWTIHRWQETTTALGRREFLRREFGEPSVLPPGWERVVADAYAHRAGA